MTDAGIPRAALWAAWCGTAAVAAVLAVLAVFAVAGCAARPAVADSRVGVYMLATACSEDLLLCTPLRAERFEGFQDCRDRIEEIRGDPDRYGVPGRPVVTGRCRSWSPPMDNVRQE